MWARISQHGTAVRGDVGRRMNAVRAGGSGCVAAARGRRRQVVVQRAVSRRHGKAGARRLEDCLQVRLQNESGSRRVDIHRVNCGCPTNPVAVDQGTDPQVLQQLPLVVDKDGSLVWGHVYVKGARGHLHVQGDKRHLMHVVGSIHLVDRFRKLCQTNTYALAPRCVRECSGHRKRPGLAASSSRATASRATASRATHLGQVNRPTVEVHELAVRRRAALTVLGAGHKAA